MTKPIRATKAEANREIFRNLILSLSGLRHWPFEDAAKSVLINILMRGAKNTEHAQRVIHWIITNRTECPTPVELLNLCDEIPAEEVKLQSGCPRCRGAYWVEALRGGVERCNCARGTRLADSDRLHRRQEEAQRVITSTETT